MESTRRRITRTGGIVQVLKVTRDLTSVGLVHRFVRSLRFPAKRRGLIILARDILRVSPSYFSVTFQCFHPDDDQKGGKFGLNLSTSIIESFLHGAVMGKIIDRVNKTLNSILIKTKLFLIIIKFCYQLFQKNLTSQNFYSTLINCNNIEI